MARDTPSQSTGCLGKILRLWILLFVFGLVAALYFIAKPQDLSDIGGYGPETGQRKPRDLKAVMQASLRQGHPLALSEAEINRWLGSTLKPRQGGALADHVSLDRVWLRLEDGVAEIVMERRVMGQPFTLSMFVMVEQTRNSSGMRMMVHRHGGKYLSGLPKPMRGGRFGTLVVPQGFLNLVVPAYGKLAELYREEIKLSIESMAVVRIENDRLILQPRPSEEPAPVF
ncbi:MAG TPA: hypothetical protein VLO11_04130 [Luteolibacter sp.]|nr:hypothetical protein [Luteolibacter sp.]